MPRTVRWVLIACVLAILAMCGAVAVIANIHSIQTAAAAAILHQADAALLYDEGRGTCDYNGCCTNTLTRWYGTYATYEEISQQYLTAFERTRRLWGWDCIEGCEAGVSNI